MFKHILVPTDGSELSELAVKRAISIAKESASGIKITFFYAMPNTAASIYGETALLRSMDPEALKKATLGRAQEILAKPESWAKEAGIAFEAMSTFSRGQVYEEIIAATTEKGCDLILMASNGYRGIKGLLLGSQTQKVLIYSKIPVLVFR
jgi:nucleotide-binding universal stress UspA family protein